MAPVLVDYLGWGGCVPVRLRDLHSSPRHSRPGPTPSDESRPSLRVLCRDPSYLRPPPPPTGLVGDLAGGGETEATGRSRVHTLQRGSTSRAGGQTGQSCPPRRPPLRRSLLSGRLRLFDFASHTPATTGNVTPLFVLPFCNFPSLIWWYSGKLPGSRVVHLPPGWILKTRHCLSYPLPAFGAVGGVTSFFGAFLHSLYFSFPMSTQGLFTSSVPVLREGPSVSVWSGPPVPSLQRDVAPSHFRRL